MTRYGMVLFLALTWLTLAGPVQAQDTPAGDGQLCVRAFEDRNGSGILDPAEPFLTRGVGASLADASGVIIQSLLLDDSPQASRGTMCFQYLPPGQYTVRVTSADFNATTGDTFLTSVTASSVPQVFDYGAQRVVAQPQPEPISAELNEVRQRMVLERLFWSLLGAIVVMGAMLVVGTIIGFLFFRPRPAAPAPGPYMPDPRMGTGPVPAAQPGTGAMRPVDPATGQFVRPSTSPPTPGSGTRPVDPNAGYMPPRPSEPLDESVMAQFTLDDDPAPAPDPAPETGASQSAMDDDFMAQFTLDDEDTGPSRPVDPVDDDSDSDPVFDPRQDS